MKKQLINTLNFAHRGFTKKYRENTLNAFEAAIKIGVDGIECDIQETADHNFIITHDSKIFGEDINQLSMTQIKRIAKKNNYEIPSLEETIALCHKRTKLMLDLKQINSLNLLANILKSNAIIDDLFLVSFNSDLISQIPDSLLEIKKGIITDYPMRNTIPLLVTRQIDLVLIKLQFLYKESVDKFYENNMAIFIWDCNDSQDIQNALSFDIDGIISDCPAIASRLLKL